MGKCDWCGEEGEVTVGWGSVICPSCDEAECKRLGIKYVRFIEVYRKCSCCETFFDPSEGRELFDEWLCNYCIHAKEDTDRIEKSEEDNV